MSADKHRSLARRIAWLRWFSCRDETGTLKPSSRATGIKGLPHITEDLLRLEAEGYVSRSRSKIGFFGRNGYTTCFEATPAGLAFLAETLRKRGADFGSVELVRSSQSDRPNKTERAERLETPMDRRLKRLMIRQRNAALLARLQAWAASSAPRVTS